MAKVVITKDRDIVDKPTQFLDNNGKWHSVSNKQEFKAIARIVKLNHLPQQIGVLITASKAYKEKNVKINPEFSVAEWVELFIK